MPAAEPAEAPAIVRERDAARAELASVWKHPVSRFARRNATALAAASAFGIVVLKILAVAQFNSRVAAALVGTTDSPAVVLDVAVYVVPLVSAFAGALIVGVAINVSPSDQRVRAALRGAAVVTAVLLLVAVPLLLLFLFLAAVMPCATVRHFRERKGPNTGTEPEATRPTNILVSVAEWAFVFGILPLLIVVSPPWMPAERVGMPAGKVEVAYVVRTDGAWTVLLIDHGRSLRYVPTADISSREPCATDMYTSTVLELITGPQLPQCYPK
jgi:hypothetical protein